MNFDDKDLAMIIILIISLASITGSYFQIDSSAIVTHAFTAVGSMAVGKTLSK